MTWKILHLNPHGDEPVLHMEDKSVDVHLVQHLDSGVVDLYIGPTSETAAIWFSIDVDRQPIVRLERCHHPTPLQCRVIQTILGTMKLDWRSIMRLVRMYQKGERPIPENKRSFFHVAPSRNRHSTR